MEDHPVPGNGSQDRNPADGLRARTGLYGVLAVVAVAGMAAAAAVIVAPGEAPVAEAPVSEIGGDDLLDVAQARLAPDAFAHEADAASAPGNVADRDPAPSGQNGDIRSMSGAEPRSTRPERTAAAPIAAEPDDGAAQAGTQEAGIQETGTQAEVAPLEADDPRWGGTAAASAAAASDDPMAAALNARTESAREGPSGSRAAYVDGGATASITGTARPSPGETVEVAETEAEIAALEASMMQDADAPDAAFGGGDTEMVLARIRSYVNLRSAPSNDSEVLTIVASDTRIQSQPLDACGHFCEVTVGGRGGFIGKSFIAFDVEPETAASAP